MKKLLGFLVLILAIGAGAYFLAPKYLPDSKITEMVESMPDIVDKIESTIEDKMDSDDESIDESEIATDNDDSDPVIPMDVAINTDVSSDIAMIGTVEEGDGFVAFTKIVDDTEVLDKVVLVTQNGETGLIEMSEEGLPSTFTIGDYKLTYSNYTQSTVDIEVTKPDGTTEMIEGSKLNMPVAKESFSLIPSAHAVGNWGPGSPATWGVVTKSGVSRAKAVKTGDTAGFTDYIFSSVGTTMNILSCGVSLSATVLTAGTTSPFAYLACGMLATRLATLNTEIGPCKGDILDCAAQTVLSSLRNKGPVIAGIATDKLTDKPVSGATIIVRNKLGKAKGRTHTNSKGFFRLPLLELGAYSITASARNYETQTFILATTNTNIQIAADDGEKPVNTQYSLSSRKYFKPIAGYFGPELKQHHNIRFDIEFGNAGEFDGDWTGRAETVVAAVPDPDFPGEWIDCGGADFSMKIDDSEIEGKADTDEGYPLTITGSVKKGGDLDAGLAYGSDNIATFDGKLREEEGQGTWSDPYGCNGGFKMTKDGTEGALPEGGAMPVF